MMFAAHEINESNVVERLLEVTPALRPEYERERQSWQDEIPTHYVFGPGLFLPYLYALLKAGKQHAQIRRIFHFIEILANHPDDGIASLVVNEIIPDLCSHPSEYEIAKNYLGTECTRVAREIMNRM